MIEPECIICTRSCPSVRIGKFVGQLVSAVWTRDREAVGVASCLCPCALDTITPHSASN